MGGFFELFFFWSMCNGISPFFCAQANGTWFTYTEATPKPQSKLMSACLLQLHASFSTWYWERPVLLSAFPQSLEADQLLETGIIHLMSWLYLTLQQMHLSTLTPSAKAIKLWFWTSRRTQMLPSLGYLQHQAARVGAGGQKARQLSNLLGPAWNQNAHIRYCVCIKTQAIMAPYLIGVVVPAVPCIPQPGCLKNDKETYFTCLGKETGWDVYDRFFPPTPQYLGISIIYLCENWKTQE